MGGGGGSVHEPPDLPLPLGQGEAGSRDRYCLVMSTAGYLVFYFILETNAGVDFKIEMSPHEKRANSNEFMEINETEFQSVSSLVRGRVKLSDVNHVSNVCQKDFFVKYSIKPRYIFYVLIGFLMVV